MQRTHSFVFNVRIKKERLSDGSHVFDVVFGSVVLHATTEKDAFAFADALVALVEQHSVDGACVMTDW